MMPRYLPVRSPFYAQWERWPYTRGPNYTRAMFREQGSGGNFTAQPMNRMPPLLGIGSVGLGDVTVPWKCWDTANFKDCAATALQKAQQECANNAPDSKSDCEKTMNETYLVQCIESCKKVIGDTTPTTRYGTSTDCTGTCAGKSGGDYLSCLKSCGTGKPLQASFFSDFWTNPTKMIGTLAVVGAGLWWMTNRKRSY